MTPQDIDGVVRCDMDTVRPNDLADALGVDSSRTGARSGTGGVAPSAQVGRRRGVLSGRRHVSVFHGLTAQSGTAYGLRGTDARAGGRRLVDEFCTPSGCRRLVRCSPSWPSATCSVRPDRQAARRIALTCRELANADPRAQMHDRPLTIDDYLSGAVISRPAQLYDFCLETDGACALVVTTTERAHDLARTSAHPASPPTESPTPPPGVQIPVRSAIASPSCRRGRSPDTLHPGQARPAGRRRRTGLRLLHDHRALQLEDAGFCAKGEGAPFVASGKIEPRRRHPDRRRGGHLSEGYIHGMNHIVEGVHQIHASRRRRCRAPR